MLSSAPAWPADDAADRTGKAGLVPAPMDETQFEAFYRRHAGAVWSYLYRMTSNPATADDLLQKTFFRFLRAEPRLESEEHLRRYLFRTATNLAMDHFRETRREQQLEPDESASIAPETAELRFDMMRLFRRLKPRERALLWLAHVEESTHEEIAASLGLQPKSIRVLLFRARKHLATILRSHGLAPGSHR